MNKHLRFALLLVVLVSLVVPGQVAFVGAQTSPSPSPTTVAPSPTPAQPSPTPQTTYSPIATSSPASGDTHGCVSPSYWDGTKCASTAGTSPYPSYSPTADSHGCVSPSYWDGTKCTTTSSGGNCPSGQYWNGNSCTTSTGGYSPEPYPSGQPYPSNQPGGNGCPNGQYFDQSQQKCVQFQSGQGTQCPSGEHPEFRNNQQTCIANQFSGGSGPQCPPPSQCPQGQFPQFAGEDPTTHCPITKCQQFGGADQSKYGKEAFQNLPPGCYFESGRVQCGPKECPDTQRSKTNAAAACEAGGTVESSSDPSGCQFYFCDFQGSGYFGGHEGFDYNQFQQGQEQAGAQQQGFFQHESSFCEPPDALKDKKNKAEATGSVCFVESHGRCSSLRCLPKEVAGQYKHVQFNAASKDAYKTCADQGGTVSLDAGACLQSPDKAVKTRGVIQPTEKVPSTLEIASTLLQLEELKPPIISLQQRTQTLEDYYKNQGDQTNLVRFQKAGDKFDTAVTNVDKVRVEIKELIETPSGSGLTGKQIVAGSKAKRTLTVHTMDKIRAEIQAKIKAPLEDAVFILAGSEKEVEKVVSDKAEDKKVADDTEFKSEMEWRIQNCKPGTVTADFSPEGAPAAVKLSMEGKIKGLSASGNCDFTVKGTFPSFKDGKIGSESADMSCSLPKDVYAAANIDEAGDEILADCKGTLVDKFKQGGGPGGQGGPGGFENGPPELAKLAKDLGGTGTNPEELKELCSESKDNAKKCYAVIKVFAEKNPQFVPQEAIKGLGCLSGELTGSKCNFGGGSGGSQRFQEPPGGGFQGLPPECAAAGATTPDACQKIMQAKYSGGQGQQGGRVQERPGGYPGQGNFQGNFPGGGATGGQFPGGPGPGPYPGGDSGQFRPQGSYQPNPYPGSQPSTGIANSPPPSQSPPATSPVASPH